MILVTRFTFIVEKSWKNMHFHSKIAWPPPTYDVISCNHRNLPSLNLTQIVRKGWTVERTSYWKYQGLMFYPLGENSEKPWGGGIHAPPPSLVHPRVKVVRIWQIISEKSYILELKWNANKPYIFNSRDKWMNKQIPNTSIYSKVSSQCCLISMSKNFCTFPCLRSWN